MLKNIIVIIILLFDVSVQSFTICIHLLIVYHVIFLFFMKGWAGHANLFSDFITARVFMIIWLMIEKENIYGFYLLK